MILFACLSIELLNPQYKRKDDLYINYKAFLHIKNNFYLSMSKIKVIYTIKFNIISKQTLDPKEVILLGTK